MDKDKKSNEKKEEKTTLGQIIIYAVATIFFSFFPLTASLGNVFSELSFNRFSIFQHPLLLIGCIFFILSLIATIFSIIDYIKNKKES